MKKTMQASALTRADFAPFGDVLECGGSSQSINQGMAQSFAGLARLEVDARDGRARARIFRVRPQRVPLQIEMLERHNLSSQLFMPLALRPFLVVVAPAGPQADVAALRAFVTNGQQGVNYRPGVWHHPVIALESGTDFLVIDREGPERDCDETSLAVPVYVEL